MRPLAPGDQALYCGLYTDTELMRHIGAPLTAVAARRAFDASCRHNAAAGTHESWVMVERAGARDIGLIVLIQEGDAAEIGAMLLGDAHNRGYAAEAITALVDLAFEETALDRLWTRHSRDNDAAHGLMRKLGFSVEDSTDAWALRWWLTRSDWAGRHDRGHDFAKAGTDR